MFGEMAPSRWRGERESGDAIEDAPPPSFEEKACRSLYQLPRSLSLDNTGVSLRVASPVRPGRPGGGGYHQQQTGSAPATVRRRRETEREMRERERRQVRPSTALPDSNFPPKWFHRRAPFLTSPFSTLPPTALQVLQDFGLRRARRGRGRGSSSSGGGGRELPAAAAVVDDFDGNGIGDASL